MRLAGAVVLAVAALVVAGCGSKSQSLPRPPETAVMRMTVKNGKPVGGIERFTVEKGKPLSIVVYSDVADEVHLHGYDKHVGVAPGPDPSIIHFDPEIPGVFVIELENRGLQIGELTVK